MMEGRFEVGPTEGRQGQLYTNYTKDNKSTSTSGRRKSSKENYG